MMFSTSPAETATADQARGERAAAVFRQFVGLCFVIAALVVALVPGIAPERSAFVAVLAMLGIGAGGALAFMPWGRLQSVWLLGSDVALAALVAAFVAFTGDADSPFSLLFFLLTAVAVVSFRRSVVRAFTAAIVALHLLPLVYGSVDAAAAFALLFSVPVHIGIVASGALVFNLRIERERNAIVSAVHADPQTLRDPLTGLPTQAALARHFQQVQASQGATSPFSIVMLRVDQWQEICDKHGRRSGDDIIRQVAMLMQSHSRSSDTPLRYDDHTFLIIFPGASAERAQKLGERLCSVVGQHRFWTPQSTERLAVQLSHGVAAYPADGDTSEDLSGIAMHRLHLFEQAQDAPTERPA